LENVARNLETVRTRMEEAALRAGRDPEGIRLLAVSKMQPVEALAEAWEAGQRDFGENYLQEALPKLDALADRAAHWHFIGALQSNKTRDVAERFDWVHTVDRESIAKRLSDQRPGELTPLHICLQVNVSGEGSKGGVAPERLPALAEAVAALPRIRLRGLMAIPAPAKDLEAQRAPFRQLRELMQDLNTKGHSLDTLSMGMSDDLEAAIAEGSTLVRVGTAVFGPRQ
jgi:pyridoxal phosphate enzyme (YggS family)